MSFLGVFCDSLVGRVVRDYFGMGRKTNRGRDPVEDGLYTRDTSSPSDTDTPVCLPSLQNSDLPVSVMVVEVHPYLLFRPKTDLKVEGHLSCFPCTLLCLRTPEPDVTVRLVLTLITGTGVVGVRRPDTHTCPRPPRLECRDLGSARFFVSSCRS